MDDLSYLLAVRKKYVNNYGKDSKYTNDINISITGSCDEGVGSAGGRGGGSVGSTGSFIACIASISATFFLHHLKYFPLTYSCSFLCLCKLPQHFLGNL